jgi:hypothetical protein
MNLIIVFSAFFTLAQAKVYSEVFSWCIDKLVRAKFEGGVLQFTGSKFDCGVNGSQSSFFARM